MIRFIFITIFLPLFAFGQTEDKLDSLAGSFEERNTQDKNAYIEFIIASEDIDPKLWKNSDINYPLAERPDWSKIGAVIKNKYPKERISSAILGAQIRWYTYKEDYQNLIKYNVQKIDTYGLDTLGWARYATNNLIYEVVFMHSNDKVVLKKALKWMKDIIETDPAPDPAHYDTYANLLYKTGKQLDAILWQKKAIETDMLNAAKNNVDPNPVFKDTLNKFENKQPTWHVK